MVYIAIASKLIAQLPSSDPAYELVFVDEFNGTTLDNTKWSQKTSWNQASNTAVCNGNITPIAYSKWRGANTNLPDNQNPDYTNCIISNGTVKLTTRQENYQGQAYYKYMLGNIY
jgi:hypothetical protein